MTNFLREVGPAGVRLDLSPELRWSVRAPGYFIEPSVGYHYTQYDLQNASYGDPSTPTRTLPFARLDTGLVFERESGADGQRTQTLEPRLVYSYVPYRNQNELPIFDTGEPDFNMVQLWRTNRFVGDDRIGDANQLALGMTTRLFNQNTGAQYLSATIGQIRYFTLPRVFLPDETTQTLPGQTSPHLTRAVLSGDLTRTKSADAARTDSVERARRNPADLPGLGHHQRGVGDGVQALERQPRLSVESLHLADR